MNSINYLVVLLLFCSILSHAELTGDVNADGKVDAADLVYAGLMVKGDVPENLTADLDNDGTVTADDLPLLMTVVHGNSNSTVIDLQNITVAGGNVGNSACNVNIPGGAFTTTSTMIVQQLPDEGELTGFESALEIYEIQGIPNTVNGSLEFSLKIPNGMSASDLAFTVGEFTETRGGIYGWRYRLVDAIELNGYLIWSMPYEVVPPTRGLTDSYSFHVTLSSITGYGYYIGDHFSIRYPSAKITKTQAIWAAEAFENAYETIKTRFGFSYAKRTTWPVVIYIKDLGAKDGEEVKSRVSVNWSWIEINSKIFSNRESVRTTCAHEFFHLVQEMYGASSRTLWLDEASSTWIEKTFSSTPATYIPSTMTNNLTEPLAGAHVQPELKATLTINPANWLEYRMNNAGDHGYGMSVFFEYLSQRTDWNDNFWVNVYSSVQSGLHPLAAINNNFTGTASFTTLWRDFLRKYPTNQIFKFSPESLEQITKLRVASRASTKYITNPAEDCVEMMEKTFSLNQLGGKFMSMLFKTPNTMPDTIKMGAELVGPDGQLYAYLFEYDGEGKLIGDPTLIAEGVFVDLTHTRLDLEIPKPAGKFAIHFLAANTNPMTPYTDVESYKLKAFFKEIPFDSFSAGFAPFADEGTLSLAVEGFFTAGHIEADIGEFKEIFSVLPKIIPGVKVYLITLATSTSTGLKIHTTGSLVLPISRTHTVPDGVWSTTANDENWSSYRDNGGLPSLEAPWQDFASVGSNGFSFPAANAGQFFSYSLRFGGNISYHYVDNDSQYTSTFTSSSNAAIPFIIILRTPTEEVE